jgi:hypothetical protein
MKMTFSEMLNEWYDYGYSEGLEGRLLQLEGDVAPEYQNAFYDGLMAGLAVFCEPEGQ